MAREMVYFDGFEGRNHSNEWAWGNYGEVPWGNRYSAPDPDRPGVLSDGRYSGQCGAGRYATYWGSHAHGTVKDPTDKYTWAQIGGNFKWNGTVYAPLNWYPVWTPRGQNTYIYDRTAGAWGQYVSTGELFWRYGSTYPTHYTFLGEYLGLTPGVYYHFEWRIGMSMTTNGTFELRVEGTQIGRWTNLITQNPAYTEVDGWNAFEFDTQDYQTDQAADLRFDDVYFMFGDSESDLFWLGPNMVEPLTPIGEGNQNDWTPSSGTNNAALVDDVPAAGDTEYVESGTAGDRELYLFTDLESDRDRTVHGVKITVRARKSNAGAKTIRHVCRIGTTNYFGDTQYVSPEWREMVYMWELSPATGVAWTEAELANAEFGYEVVA